MKIEASVKKCGFNAGANKMKNLSIVALSIVVILNGCAGYSSRTLQPKQQRVDDSRAKKARIKRIDMQKAAKIAIQALEDYKYSITNFKCESNDYACVKANTYVGFLSGHKYRTDIKITKKDQGHEYKVSSRRKYVPFLEFNPLKWYHPYHRDKNEEKKILDAIEQKYQ